MSDQFNKSGWQPIETAPKDGTMVQVRAGKWAEVHAWWNRNDWSFIEYSHPLGRQLTEWRKVPV